MKGIKICEGSKTGSESLLWPQTCGTPGEELRLEVQSERYCVGSTKRSYWRSVGWTEEHVHVRKSREAWEICQSRTGRDCHQRSKSFISIFWYLWNNFVSVLCGLKVWRATVANMCACPTLLPFFVVSTGQHQSRASSTILFHCNRPMRCLSSQLALAKNPRIWLMK